MRERRNKIQIKKENKKEVSRGKINDRRKKAKIYFRTIYVYM
jgi:hypothetical protein